MKKVVDGQKLLVASIREMKEGYCREGIAHHEASRCSALPGESMLSSCWELR